MTNRTYTRPPDPQPCGIYRVGNTDGTCRRCLHPLEEHVVAPPPDGSRCEPGQFVLLPEAAA